VGKIFQQKIFVFKTAKHGMGPDLNTEPKLFRSWNLNKLFRFHNEAFEKRNCYLFTYMSAGRLVGARPGKATVGATSAATDATIDQGT
jgi:hypothetical protein